MIKGYEQTDYGEMYAPFGKLTIFRLLISLAIRDGWNIDHLDVVSTFLNSEQNHFIKSEADSNLYICNDGDILLFLYVDHIRPTHRLQQEYAEAFTLPLDDKNQKILQNQMRESQTRGKLIQKNIKKLLALSSIHHSSHGCETKSLSI
jgi:hypothetical protein